MAYQAGREVDETDVIFFILGCTAVAATFAAGGSSLIVEAGAGLRPS